jgi:hypothetical protein
MPNFNRMIGLSRAGLCDRVQKVALPGASRDQLKRLAEFRYLP